MGKKRTEIPQNYLKTQGIKVERDKTFNVQSIPFGNV